MNLLNHGAPEVSGGLVVHANGDLCGHRSSDQSVALELSRNLRAGLAG
jgi:hypothetical protein